MNYLRSRIQKCLRSETGATLIIVAVCMSLGTAIFTSAIAFSVELGMNVDVNRSLQSVADAGALSAARYIDITGAGASTFLTQADAAAAADGVTTSTSSTAVWPEVYMTATPTSGFWSATCGWTSTSCGGDATISAVKVTATTHMNHILANGNVSLSRSATAAVTPEAGFSIGTGLASFSTSAAADNSGVMNSLLTALGGPTISFGAVQYNGLATADVTLQQLINANTTVLSTSTILTAALSDEQWVSILDGADSGQAVSVPFTTPSSCTDNGTTCVTLCQLVSIGNYCPNTAMPPTGLNASINVLQTLTTAAELANGSNAISLTSALQLGGVSASISLNLISPPTVAYGPVGTTASTGQVDADLKLSLSALGISLGLLDINATGATGTAALSAVNCTNNGLTSVALNGSTNLATTSVSLLGITVPTSLTGASSTTKTYNTAAIPPTTSTLTATGNNQNPQTIGTTDPTIGIPVLGTIGTLIGGLTSFLTSNLSPVLQTLGVSLANADMEALSATCGSVSLVQ